jgi:S-adenosylmethionine/arginine decarboxylase-like enzyme
MYWGYHLILDCARCSPSKIRNKYVIEHFARTLVKKIDMVAYGLPQVEHFGSGNKGGYTLVQLIETSNITAHFVEETDDMYLDVFSCKPYDPDVVKKVVTRYFTPIGMHSKFLVRQAGMNPLVKTEFDRLV